MDFVVNGLNLGKILEQVIQKHLDSLDLSEVQRPDQKCVKGHCGEENDSKPVSELLKKTYRVHLDGEHFHVEGDGLYERDDGSIAIYSDVRNGTVKAIFNNWDAIFFGES